MSFTSVTSEGKAATLALDPAEATRRIVDALREQVGETLKRRGAVAQPNTIYARDAEPLINEREAAEEEVRELLSLAEQLEGLPRNVGMHAGGVLIAPGKLTDFCPLYLQAGSDALVSQFDKDDVELVGLVKFDFLGLTTLTILDWTLRYLRKLDPDSALTLETLPLDDKAAYDIFKNGNTTAVFQFDIPAASLPPGLYTALLVGRNNGTGIGVVEIYDRGAPPAP